MASPLSTITATYVTPSDSHTPTSTYNLPKASASSTDTASTTLTRTAKIAIGAGVGVAVFILLAAILLAALHFRRRNRLSTRWKTHGQAAVVSGGGRRPSTSSQKQSKVNVTEREREREGRQRGSRNESLDSGSGSEAHGKGTVRHADFSRMAAAAPGRSSTARTVESSGVGAGAGRKDNGTKIRKEVTWAEDERDMLREKYASYY